MATVRERSCASWKSVDWGWQCQKDLKTMQLMQFLVAWGDNKNCFARRFFFLIAFRCFSGKKSAQESGQTWGFKFVAKKKPYGPLRDRDWTVSGKVGNIQFSFTFKRKTKKSEILPWPDRDGTVTGPWQPDSETANWLCCAQCRLLQVD
jgi:hypothetical protein